MDTDTLSKIVPGISKLEKTGDHSYKSTLQIKIGPVGGSFTGNLQMENIREARGIYIEGAAKQQCWETQMQQLRST
jgi:carbon monoxide dehydrogenase subunit G